MKALSLLVMMTFASKAFQSETNKLRGTWQAEVAGVTTVRIYTDAFFSVSIFKADAFVGTYGGRYQLVKGAVLEKIEFDNQNPERIGTETRIELDWNKKADAFTADNSQGAHFKRVDDGTPGKLFGAWLITGRFNNKEMTRIKPGAP